MKLNRIITLCAMAAALALGAGSALAQDNGGNRNGGGQRRNGQAAAASAAATLTRPKCSSA